jgi:8-oxo-dGTP pyrophosphatase MutT (NUDIX family)
MLLGKREIYAGRIVRLNLEQVRLPNGHETDLEIVHHPGGAAVVAVDTALRVCLLRQYRHAAGGYIWELPAGKLEPHEPPALTAARELGEEAGQSAARWDWLGHYISSPGVFTERIHLYLARDLTPTATAVEAAEVLEVHWVPLADALRRAAGGDIVDAKTALGLWRAHDLLSAPLP